MEPLGDLLFELSNDERLSILLKIRGEPMRLTNLSKELGLTVQAISRHLSRLDEVGLTQKGTDGKFSLTPYGELVIRQLQEWEFMSRHRTYFTTHSSASLPQVFVKQIGDLTSAQYLDSVMDFLRYIETTIKEAEEFVWFQVDQYPVNALAFIHEALDRGVRLRCIEPRELVSGPAVRMFTPEEERGLNRTRSTPLVEKRTLESIDVFLFQSEKRCALAFPTSEGGFDYRGFTADDDRSLEWCEDLFRHYWEAAEPKVYISPTEYVHPSRTQLPGEETHRSIVVEGKNDSKIDAQAVQDAVDNYDEVTLRGTFNFGSSMVEISRSVVVKGEGREGDIPSTTIYKKGWAFPFREWTSVFKVDGEDTNVTIENIQFTDFNCICIWGRRGNSLIIKDNRIVLSTGYGRGVTSGAFGDWVIGIHVEPEPLVVSLRGGVTLEGNYIDFASHGLYGGHFSRGGLEEDPEYRPDLLNHEYYVGLGVTVWNLPGLVKIENNVVRNANAKGIAASNNLASADVRIRCNTIMSDVYGSYLISSPEAGVGILAQSALRGSFPGFNVEIEDNTIKLNKPNYSGITVLGPATDREGADKLRGGSIKNNRIHLKSGYEGIHVRKCDDFEVADNTISGEAYYGIRVSGRRRSKETDLRALNNIVEGNDMDGLRIRDPDDYSDNHADGRMFAGTPRGSATAHIWLDKNTKGNVFKIGENETLIDDGEDNQLSHHEK